MQLLLRCPKCKRYSIRPLCEKCKELNVNPDPPRFSPVDKYGHYRRKMKKLNSNPR